MNADVLKILARRSVRTYTRDPVDDEAVRTLLKAAMAAPSAAAADPWCFLVVRSPGMLVRLAELLPRGAMVAEAQVGIVVCGDQQRAHRHQLSYMLQDCSAATENLLLAASMLGLGACWLGIHPDPVRVAEVRKLFGIPPAITPVAGVAIGHPMEHPPARTRFREDAVHREVW
ncbi:MAG: nitroreductase family protein [Kiritimatiellae bacterium]|nr:nitroreductase family protein [Kiritimatiellia bacterium]